MNIRELKAVSQELRKYIIRTLVVAGSGWQVSILATGGIIENSVKAGVELKRRGIDAEVMNIHTLKPIDEELIADRSKSHGKFVAVKDYGITGGLERAVADLGRGQVKRICVQDFSESGDVGYAKNMVNHKKTLLKKSLSYFNISTPTPLKYNLGSHNYDSLTS